MDDKRRKLTIRQEMFIAGIVDGLNGVEAAKAAYPGLAHNSAKTMAWKLLRRQDVQAAIKKQMEFRRRVIKSSKERLIARLSDIAFAEGHKLLNRTGDRQWALRPIEEIPLSTLRAINKVKVLRETTQIFPPGADEAGERIVTEQVIEISMIPPDASLEKLAKYHNLYADKDEITEIEERIAEAEAYTQRAITHEQNQEPVGQEGGQPDQEDS